MRWIYALCARSSGALIGDPLKFSCHHLAGSGSRVGPVGWQTCAHDRYAVNFSVWKHVGGPGRALPRDWCQPATRRQYSLPHFSILCFCPAQGAPPLKAAPGVRRVLQVRCISFPAVFLSATPPSSLPLPTSPLLSSTFLSAF